MNEEQRLLLIEALMHLEEASDKIRAEVEDGLALDLLREVEDRMIAAHYLTQKACYGHMPDNYEEMLENARRWDARACANEAIQRARGPK